MAENGCFVRQLLFALMTLVAVVAAATEPEPKRLVMPITRVPASSQFAAHKTTRLLMAEGRAEEPELMGTTTVPMMNFWTLMYTGTVGIGSPVQSYAQINCPFLSSVNILVWMFIRHPCRLENVGPTQVPIGV
jgi:hypothetical protein